MTACRVYMKKDRATNQLRLVHGFRRGTSPSGMIRDECRYHSKVLRIIPGDNPGITILPLKELY